MKGPIFVVFVRAAFAVMVVLLVGACQTSSDRWSGGGSTPPDLGELKPGNVVAIRFPGAPEFNSVQKVSRDGTLNLPMIGEVSVENRRSGEVQQELRKKYKDELQVNEVLVTVESKKHSIFVTGAVLRPGRVESERPISALRAIMEAGGFDQSKARASHVIIIRDGDMGDRERHVLNLKPAINGRQSEPFYLKPDDMVYVPERVF